MNENLLYGITSQKVNTKQLTCECKLYRIQAPIY